MSEYLKHSAQALNEAITRVRNNYRDCSSVDAVAGDVAVGKKIVDNLGAVIEGTLDVNVHYNEGYTKGEEAGYNTGYAEGEVVGDAAGYERGYNEGLEDATPTLESKTVTPAAESQTIIPSDGYDGLASVVVEGDSDLVPENIKQGVSLFGVEGSAIADTDGMYCWAKFSEKTELPAGYTKLESLTTSGSMHFDTGYLLDATSYTNFKVEADIAISTSTSNYKVTGSGGGSPMFYIGIRQDGKFGYACGTSDATTGVTGDAGRHLYTLDIPNKKYTVDNLVNTTISPAAGNSYPRNFFISGYHLPAGSSDTTWRHIETIYSYKLYKSGALVKHFVPCLDASGACCLYDLVNGATNYAVGGTPTAGTNLGKVEAEGYILSDDLNAFPQDGYHTDGYYYKLLDNDIAWDERGRYAWEKESVTKTYPALTATGITLTKERNSYSATTQTGNGWGGTKYFNSNVITIDSASVVDVYHTYNTGSTEYYFGFAANSTTAYTDITSYVRIVSATIYSRSGSTGTSCTAGDVIHLQLKGGLMLVYKNDTLVFSESTSFNQCVVAAHFYHGSKTYAFEISAEISETLGYVVSNKENAYPNDGFADDGYYYVKVGATKVTPKYASGTVSQTSNIVSVSGLGFKPISVTVYCGNVVGTGQGSCAWGLVNESGASQGYYVRGAYGGDASFSATDDGFSIKSTNATTSSASTYSWYAIGY